MKAFGEAKQLRMSQVPIVLSIAGSDSSAGAGIQADLKTFAALKVYGVTAITAVTAQNTLGVSQIVDIDPSQVASQIDAVVLDPGVSAVKIGMLSNSSIVEEVARRIEAHRLTRVVLDPVMVAKGGARLIQEDAISALRTLLLPLATVVTPNAPEAEVLTGLPVRNLRDAKKAARKIASMGPEFVVVKGGHFGKQAIDVLFGKSRVIEFVSPRIPTTSTHGTGCTFSSAIAAGLAQNLPISQAVHQAKEFVTAAIAHALPIGSGHGPLNHFHQWWK